MAEVPEANLPRAERGTRTALAGFACAGLFVAGWALLRNSPGLSEPSADLVAFYADPDRRRGSLIAGLYLIPFAGIAFVWFMAALRARYIHSGGSENLVLSTVQLLTGTLFVVALFVIGAVRLALVLLAQEAANGVIDADSVRAMVALATALAEIVGLRAGAVFVAVSSTRAMKSGLFPRWFGVVSLLVAATLLFTFAAWPPIVLLMPAWVVATSLFVLSARQSQEVPHQAGRPAPPIT
jgi:hypothetical protein